jgi:hypothetical protein
MIWAGSFLHNWTVMIWWGKWFITIWKHPLAGQRKIEFMRSR